jgi:hypothetical protein
VIAKERDMAWAEWECVLAQASKINTKTALERGKSRMDSGEQQERNELKDTYPAFSILAH